LNKEGKGCDVSSGGQGPPHLSYFLIIYHFFTILHCMQRACGYILKGGRLARRPINFKKKKSLPERQRLENNV
jgi:hypothetical protein